MGTVDTSFGALPPLAQGTDVCDAAPGSGGDGTHPLSGSLVDVCITH
jgi:hypothetical protein